MMNGQLLFLAEKTLPVDLGTNQKGLYFATKGLLPRGLLSDRYEIVILLSPYPSATILMYCYSMNQMYFHVNVSHQEKPYSLASR